MRNKFHEAFREVGEIIDIITEQIEGIDMSVPAKPIEVKPAVAPVPVPVAPVQPVVVKPVEAPKPVIVVVPMVEEKKAEVPAKTNPSTELRKFYIKLFDLDKDNDVDKADVKIFIKTLGKYIVYILAVIGALIGYSPGNDPTQINIFGVSGWITIGSVICIKAYDVFKDKQNTSAFLAKIKAYRELIMTFIDFIQDLILNKEKLESALIWSDFIIKIKDELARLEIVKSDAKK